MVAQLLKCNQVLTRDMHNILNYENINLANWHTFDLFSTEVVFILIEINHLN